MRTRWLVSFLVVLLFVPVAAAIVPTVTVTQDGRAVTMSATTDGTFDFGDGRSVDGRQVAHIYAAPGTYEATFSAAGFSTSLSVTEGAFVPGIDIAGQSSFLLPAVPRLGERFGASIDGDGDFIAVGSPDHIGNGSVTVFQKDGLFMEPYPRIADCGPDSQMGASVGLHGTTLLAGCPGIGQARSYVLTDGAWVPEHTFTMPGLADFGRLVAIEGDKAIIVGTTEEEGTRSHFHNYTRTASGWVADESPVRIDGDPVAARILNGESLHVTEESLVQTVAGVAQDDLILIGAVSAAWNLTHILIGFGSGDIKQYARDPFLLQGILASPLDTATPTGYGSSLAMHGGRVFVGAPGDGVTGKVYALDPILVEGVEDECPEAARAYQCEPACPTNPRIQADCHPCLETAYAQAECIPGCAANSFAVADCHDCPQGRVQAQCTRPCIPESFAAADCHEACPRIGQAQAQCGPICPTQSYVQAQCEPTCVFTRHVQAQCAPICPACDPCDIDPACACPPCDPCDADPSCGCPPCDPCDPCIDFAHAGGLAAIGPSFFVDNPSTPPAEPPVVDPLLETFTGAIGSVLYADGHLWMGAPSDGSVHTNRSMDRIAGPIVVGDAWIWPPETPLSVKAGVDPDDPVHPDWTDHDDTEIAVFHLAKGKHTLTAKFGETTVMRDVHVCEIVRSSGEYSDTATITSEAGSFSLAYTFPAEAELTGDIEVIDCDIGYDDPGAPPYQSVKMVSIKDGPGQLAGAEKIRLSIQFDPAQLGSAVNRLAIHYWNGGQWVRLPDVERDIPGATPVKDLHVFGGGRNATHVWVDVNHTSTYGLFVLPGGGGGGGYTPPAPPAPDPAPTPPAPPAPAPAPAPAPSAPSSTGPPAGLFGDGSNVDIQFFDTDGNPVGELARGTLTVQVKGAPEGFRLVVVNGPEETVIPLVAGRGEYESSGNGYARFEVRYNNALLEWKRLFIENPRVSVEQSAVTFAAAGAALGLGSIVAGPINEIFSAAFGAAVEETAIAMTEEQIRKKRRRELIKKSLISLVVAALLMTVFFTFEGMETMSATAFAKALPWVGGAAVLMFAMAAFVEEGALVASRSTARFRFHLGGAIVLAVSAIFLRTAMGLPGFVDEIKAKGSPVIRSLAAISGYVGLVVPFAALATLRYDFYEVGAMMCMAALATAALPFKPMPGNDVWHTHKGVSLLVAGAAMSFYGAFLVGAIGPTHVLMIGSIGLVLWASMCWLMWAQEMAWYIRLSAKMIRFETRVIRDTPAWLATVLTMPHRVLAWLGLGLDRSLEKMEHGIEHGTEVVIHATHLDRIGHHEPKPNQRR